MPGEKKDTPNYTLAFRSVKRTTRFIEATECQFCRPVSFSSNVSFLFFVVFFFLSEVIVLLNFVKLFLLIAHFSLHILRRSPFRSEIFAQPDLYTKTYSQTYMYSPKKIAATISFSLEMRQLTLEFVLLKIIVYLLVQRRFH